jgi:hypothetical protein
MFHCTLGSDETNIFTRWTKGWARVTCIVGGMWSYIIAQLYSEVKWDYRAALIELYQRSVAKKCILVIVPVFENISMDDSSYRWNFDLDKKNEIHIHSWIEHLEMSNVWLRFVVEWGKYSPVKFANFVYICIMRGKNKHF